MDTVRIETKPIFSANDFAAHDPTLPRNRRERRAKAAAYSLPNRKPDGEFQSFESWVENATRWIGGTNPLCADAKGRVCTSGADMMRARDQGAFPVRFWCGEGGRSAAEQQKAQKRADRLLRRGFR